MGEEPLYAHSPVALAGLSVPRRAYMGTSLIRKRTSLGPYRRPMPRVIGRVIGGWAFSYGRGTPVSVPRRADQFRGGPAIESRGGIVSPDAGPPVPRRADQRLGARRWAFSRSSFPHRGPFLIGALSSYGPLPLLHRGPFLFSGWGRGAAPCRAAPPPAPPSPAVQGYLVVGVPRACLTGGT